MLIIFINIYACKVVTPLKRKLAYICNTIGDVYACKTGIIKRIIAYTCNTVGEI